MNVTATQISGLLQHEPQIRLVMYILAISLFAYLEARYSARPLKLNKTHRWLGNFSLVFMNTLLLRITLPVSAVAFTEWVKENKFGLFHSSVFTPFYETASLFIFLIMLNVVILDCAIYWQHRLFHKWSILWRFHRVHHVDLDFDVSTAGRFHPVEILLSMAIKFAVIFIFGPTAIAVFIFELLLSTGAIFNHSNMFLPQRLDKALRQLLVTPNMHRIHHSKTPIETDSNFGFFLSWWDKLFGTYQVKTLPDLLQIEIGLKAWPQKSDSTKLWQMLALPFKPDRANQSPNLSKKDKKRSKHEQNTRR